MMFGIIEFGRIFQAWVSLQNAARAAARYASTGLYDKSLYVMKTDSRVSDPTGFIPCVDDREAAYGGADQRGTPVTNYLPIGNAAGDTYQVYQGGLESLFATWYGGKNCDPTSPIDQERRIDMARLLSIMQEARKGAGGLAIEADYLTRLGSDVKNIDGWPWFEVWKRPQPRADQRGWFNVMVCSTRGMLRQDSTPYFQRAAGSSRADQQSRFLTYLGSEELYNKATGALIATPPNPACLLNEVQVTTAAGETNNGGKPWLDPGGPVNTVTVVITFNHPLITPLGLGPYLQIQARRTAIVEAFRAPDASSAFLGAPGIGDRQPTFTFTPTNTFTPTPLPSATRTPTPLPTATHTKTPPPPFNCSLVTAGNLNLSGNLAYIKITNANQLNIVLTAVRFVWKPLPAFPNLYVSQFALDGIPHWQGIDKVPPMDTNAVDPGAVTTLALPSTAEQDRTIAGGGSTATWTGTFNNGPAALANYLTSPDFGGTQFTFVEPVSGQACTIALEVPPVTPAPTLPPGVTPSATPTPDCTNGQVSVRFVSFRPIGGLVELQIINSRNAVVTLTDFLLQWNQRAPGILTLARVAAGAPPGQSNSVLVWQAGSPTEDSQPPTQGRGEGTWIQNYSVDAQTSASLFLDFDGFPGSLGSVGMQPNDFASSQFTFDCGAGSGTTIITQPPTPQPTFISTTTLTPSITFTPSMTPTPRPVTIVPTGITPTRTPTATKTPTPTRAPTQVPTDPPLPCPDGNCQ
jgi:hypothetical protein